MSVLDIKNLKFKYTEQELFNDISFRLFANDHMGLIGINGAGKSTFLNIIAQNIKPDTGSIKWAGNVTYGYMDQHIKINKKILIIEYLYDVYSNLFEKEKEMEALYLEASTNNKALEYATRIQDELIQKDFYSFKSRIGNIISGLGIDQKRIYEPISNLSGGQRAKVLLGKLLLEEPDILLMDEPTNFLDTTHVDWLTKYLKNYSKAFIVISHDNTFISDISNVICALENKTIIRYKGDYSFYLKEHELRTLHHQKNFTSQQKFIKQTETFIKKNITRSSTSKRAKSRVKMLDKIDIITPPLKNKKVFFSFPFSKSIGVDALVVNELEVGYNYKILPKISFIIKNNQKVVITGHNGIGKSTILKTLIGDINKLGGKYAFSKDINILYFSQENTYDLELSPFDIIKQDFPEMDNQTVRKTLSKVGINKTLVVKKLKELSGGEQTRARMAKLSLIKSNLLILDEPTNHLDELSKKALFKAIKEYPGNILLVSHEKEFYKSLTNIEINIDNMV